jgi:DnaJ family protein C protein 7
LDFVIERVVLFVGLLYLQLVACKAEAYLKLHRLDDAESCFSNIPKLEGCPQACSQAKFFGMVGETFVHFVSAQVDMALGR